MAFRHKDVLTGWDDARLMDAIKSGDSAALEVLFDRHGALVLGVCRRTLGDSPEADEVLIDVFQQIWQRADRYDPVRATPVGFLIMIARSRAIDSLRSRTRARRTSFPIDASDEALLDRTAALHDRSRGPFAGAENSQQRERILAALSDLPDSQRQPLELSFYLGLTHREIADRIELPLGTVKTRIRQGLLRLREILAGRGIKS